MQRAQLAVLRCLQQIATHDAPLAIAGVSSRASDALLPALHTLLPAVGDAMGGRHPAPVRERATQVCARHSATLTCMCVWACQVLVVRMLTSAAVVDGWLQAYIALARVDPDAAWCQLTAASLQGKPALGGTPAEVDVPRMAVLHPPACLLTASGVPLVFPERSQIEPPLPALHSGEAAEAALRQQRSAAKTATGLAVPEGLLECSAAKLNAMMQEVEKMLPSWHDTFVK